jgi:hypothetical protein
MGQLAEHTLIVLAAYGGWLLIALQKARHFAAVSDSKLDARARTRVRGLGSLLLAASFVMSLLVRGASFGALFGVMVLSLGAFAVTLTLAFCPRWTRPIAKLLVPR